MGVSRPASRQSGWAILIRARATVIATGESGHLCTVTTNPASANGEALAMAARAGAQISDSEFIQFHPTALTGMGDPAPLATEALRGAGAYLVDADGHRFMADIHPDGDLAPRDVVARRIRSTPAHGVCRAVSLRASVGNLSGNLSDNLVQRFPNIHATCVKHKLDPSSPLPVAPAAHFTWAASARKSWSKQPARFVGVWRSRRDRCTWRKPTGEQFVLEAIVFGARIAEDV